MRRCPKTFGLRRVRDAMGPVHAPDGRHIAYAADRSSSHVLDPAAGAEVLPPGQVFAFDEPGRPA